MAQMMRQSDVATSSAATKAASQGCCLIDRAKPDFLLFSSCFSSGSEQAVAFPEAHAARVLGFVETFTNTAAVDSRVAVAPSGTVWEATHRGIT